MLKIRAYIGCLVLGILTCLAAAQPTTGKADSLLLTSFEEKSEAITVRGKLVKENATEGATALKVEANDDYEGFTIADPQMLQKFRDYSKLEFDVFNPQDKPVKLDLRADDAKTKAYDTRHNDDNIVAKPGKSTISIYYGNLVRFSTRNDENPEILDAANLKLIGVFLTPDKKGNVLFVDNIRLSGPVKPEDKAEIKPGASLLIDSFEENEPAPQGQGKVVEEQATHGKRSYKFENVGDDYKAYVLDDVERLKRFRSFQMLKFDVFNPQSKPVGFLVRVDDAASNNYGNRYNDDFAIAAPGKSTYVVNLTSLMRTNGSSKLDRNALKMLMIGLGPQKDKTVLFIDNIRLENSPLPKVEGLRAFDFGPYKSAVYPGFDGITPATAFNESKGLGWINPGMAQASSTPDALTSDFGTGKEFRLKVPNGTYEVNLCMDAFGVWGWYPSWQWRKLSLNGKEVLNQKMTAAEFLEKCYFAHEDDEDLPGQNWWDKYIASRQIIQRYSVEVTDGYLHVEPSADNPWGAAICFLVVYPDAQKTDGRKFMDTLDKARRDEFAKRLIIDIPKADGPAPTPSDKDKARGYIPFVRSAEIDINCTSVPAKDELNRGIALPAARGERVNAQIGLFPVADAAKIKVAVSDLAGQGGAKIPASAVSVRKVRNFLKREVQTQMGRIAPHILLPLPADAQGSRAVDLVPGVTRGLWVTMTVPADAAEGKYAGAITLGEGDKATRIPVAIEVLPFVPDKVTDMAFSAMGTSPGRYNNYFPELEELWWKTAEVVMKNLADHGMNAVSGGPGATIRSVKGGKIDIDYTQFDRWLTLATAAGLTMPGDSYQGLDLVNLPRDNSKDCMAINEARSKELFGVPYSELLKLAYADVDRHCKEKGFAKRVFYFLDEPRPEFENVEPAAQLIKTLTAASPDTLFSGYYSDGDGRDQYFATMPVSIAHNTKRTIELCAKAGKQAWDYDGDGVRHNIGRWCFVAKQAGLKGYLKQGYLYVASAPYFDFSDTEGCWAFAWPSRNGINDTPGWERTSDGAYDYRYLVTCQRLIKQARAAGKAAKEADAAEAYMAQTLKPILLDDRKTARLTPAEYDGFRRTLAGHILALKKALGE